MLATLDLTHVGPFYSGQARQGFLGYASLQPRITHRSTKGTGNSGVIRSCAGRTASLNSALLHEQKRGGS